MEYLNRSWLYLIFIGVAVLVLLILWEIFQVSSGVKSNFELVVIEMDRDVLIPANLEDHFKSSSAFSSFSEKANQ